MPNNLKQKLSTLNPKQLTAGFFVIAFALTGVYYLLQSHAAPYAVATEAESGSLGGNASIVNDSSASGARAVEFGSTSTGGGSGSGGGSSSGFVTASGQNFMLSGKVFKFIGFDAYGMSGCYSGSAWTTSQLDAYFSSLPAHGVTRLWAMQDYGTGPINAVLTEAAKYKQHVILTLSNESSTCDSGDGSSGNKSDSYFQSGYESTLIPWINNIVPMFKNNKSILMWEIMNEPVESNESTMKSFLQATSNAIREDDPNHLIAVGSEMTHLTMAEIVILPSTELTKY